MSRKSLASIVLDTQQVLNENDDEAERLLLRNSKENNSTIDSRQSNRRQSLGLSNLVKIPEPQMKEHIMHCIKLNTEKKINIKNAFTLEMIDFMTFMVSKKKSEVDSFQTASVALDVCSNIYAYRVDGLYTAFLKIAGGLDKHEKEIENDPNKEELCQNEEMQVKSQVKKKRKNNQKIISTESVLKGCVNTSYPMQSFLGSGDSCTSDMLCQTTLPIHANFGFYYHQYNDIILDTVDDITEHETNSSEVTIAAIKDFANLDICQSFSDFTFSNSSYEDEPEVTDLNQQNNENRFQFDLDASIFPTEELESEPANYFDIQEDEDNVNLYTRNPEQVENIVDLRNIVVTQVPELNKSSEYSFIHKNCIHWAGPSYWKIKRFGKVLSNSKVVETCHQTGVKKKKALVLEYNDNVKSVAVLSFAFAQTGKIHFKTTPKSWKGTKKTLLPEDVHYEDSQLYKLYIHPSITRSCNKNVDQLDMKQLSTDENYDYNNENDTSDHSLNIDAHNEEMQEMNNLKEFNTEDQDTAENFVAFTGDNLVVLPTMTQKIVVPYALRAKKLDMRQLKNSIWKVLSSSNNKEKAETENANIVKETKPFNMVYESLSTELSKTNREALTFPVAFVSLLHLANEKSLNISSVPDLSDIIINED